MLFSPAVSLCGMANDGVRNDPISVFVREWLQRLEKEGAVLVPLALAVKLPKSHPSQVKSGSLGVGPKVLHKYARWMGYSSSDALAAAAYEAWLAKHYGAATGPTQAQIDARADLLRDGHATEAEIDAILIAYRHERFLARDRAWWIQTILSELRESRRTTPEAPKSDKIPRRRATAGRR